MSESHLNLLGAISVVLVETSHPGNIGAAARACKTMGISKLVLVAPKDFPSEEAVSRASGAEDVLTSATVVDSLADALAEQHIVVGASARGRKLTWPVVNPRECSDLVAKRLTTESTESELNRVALVFGRESSGLSNDELQRCHYHVNVPANPDYSSLNLAMAVQVICYEFRMKHLELSSDPSLQAVLSSNDDGWGEPKAEVAEVEGFLEHLESTLVEIEYLDPDKPRMLMERLRRLFQRANLDKMEVNILRGILKNVLQSKSRG